MNKFFAVFVALFCVTSTFAGGLNYDPKGPSMDQVKAVRAKLEAKIQFSSNGINGIGITACETETGTSFIKYDQDNLGQKLFVNCIEVMAASEDALAAFQAQYPNQGKVDGVYVVSEYIGVVRPQ